MLAVGLLACCSKDFYNEQIKACKETWCNSDIPIYYFTGEKCSGNCENNVIHLPNVKDDVLSATYKQWNGLRWLYEKHPEAKFYYFAGTDTYARLDKLIEYLKNMNSEENLYIGGHGFIRNETGKEIYFHSGGSGFILSNSLMKNIYELIPDWIEKWNSHTNWWIKIACDWSIGCLFDHYNIDIKTIKSDNFYACNWKGFVKGGKKCCNDINIEDLLVCHYMEPNDMKEIHKMYNNSLEILREINKNINERNFHEHTHILYDLRTNLGNKKKVYLEIGSYVGSSACLIMSHPFPTMVYCVDPCILDSSHYSGNKNQIDTLYSNIANNKNNSESSFMIYPYYSNDAINNLKDKQIDILFIDGDHRYQGVIDDFDNYSGLVSDGGYIVFDDYLDEEHSPEVKKAVDQIVSELDKSKFQILGTPSNKFNALPNSPERFKNLNEFIIRKINCSNEKLFAIVIPTYQRKNGMTRKNIEKVSDFLSKQTYQNFHIFLIGDDYEDEEEFKQLVSLFPEDKIYSYNNNKSYRKDYFSLAKNKWCIGGVMALEYGVTKAKELGFKYYLHLDDDDSWSLDKLEKHKKYIDTFPESDFIFHGSYFGDKILPREHKKYNLEYNNLLPRAENIVHSTNCLSLNNFDIFMKYTKNIMDIAEKIKNKEIEEYLLYPFDAGFINFIRSKDFKFLYIPEILSKKETDGNIPS